MTDTIPDSQAKSDSQAKANAPSRDRVGEAISSINWPTLTAGIAVSVFLWQLGQNDLNSLGDRVESVIARVGDIPTKSEMGAEIEQVAEIQRANWDANAARVEASATAMNATAEGIRAQIAQLEANNRQVTSMLNERVNALDTRIANIGVDYSGALIEYFRTGRTGAVVSGDGTGGPDGAEDVYRDYSIRLVVRDANMPLADAIEFVDRAFLNQRGPEATRLAEIARAARERGRGVAND